MSTSKKSSTSDKKKYYKKAVTFSVILSTEKTEVLKDKDLLTQLAYLNNYGHIDRILLDIGKQAQTEKAFPEGTLKNENIKEEFASNIEFKLNNIPISDRYVFLTDDESRLEDSKYNDIKGKKIVPIVCSDINKIKEMVKFLQRLRFENEMEEEDKSSRKRNVYVHVDMGKPAEKFNNLHKHQKSAKVLGRIKRYMKTKLGKLSMDKGYYKFIEDSDDYAKSNNELTINIGLQEDIFFNVSILIDNNNSKFVEHLILGEPENRLSSKVVKYLEGEIPKPQKTHKAKNTRGDRSEQSTKSRRRRTKKGDITRVSLKNNSAATESFKEYDTALSKLDQNTLKDYSNLKQKLSYLNMKKEELKKDIEEVDTKLTNLKKNMSPDQVKNLEKFTKKEKLDEKQQSNSFKDKPRIEKHNAQTQAIKDANNIETKREKAFTAAAQEEARSEKKAQRQKERNQASLKYKVKKQLSELGKTKKKGFFGRLKAKLTKKRKGKK